MMRPSHTELGELGQSGTGTDRRTDGLIDLYDAGLGKSGIGPVTDWST